MSQTQQEETYILWIKKRSQWWRIGGWSIECEGTHLECSNAALSVDLNEYKTFIGSKTSFF
jgi:hypothetical protein